MGLVRGKPLGDFVDFVRADVLVGEEDIVKLNDIRWPFDARHLGVFDVNQAAWRGNFLQARHSSG